MSIKLALEMLGFGPCYHMREVLASRPGPDHVRLWRDAARGVRVNWRVLFHGYMAAVDMPAAAFYRDILSTYPNARVLLSVRDPARWYASLRETLYALRSVRDPSYAAFTEMVDEVFWEGILHGRFEDEAYAIGVYEQHIESVKRTVTPSQLLVLDVKDGWEPLCRFLEVPMPETAFPHVNDSQSFVAFLRLKWPEATGSPSGACGPAEEYEQQLHRRMQAFEKQLLEEIRGSGREDKSARRKP
jgi:hypothetical protein